MRFLKLSLLSPMFIIMFFGGLGLVINLFKYSEWSQTHFVYVSGIFFFVTAYFITKFLVSFSFLSGKWRVLPLKFEAREANSLIIKSYWVLAFVGGSGAVYQMYSVGFLGGGSFFFNLRYAHTVEHSSLPFIEHLSLFSLVLSLYYSYRGEGRLALIALSLSILGTLAIAARTGILLKLSSVLYLYLLVRGASMKVLLYGVAVFFVLVFGVALGAGKINGLGTDNFLFTYLGYGLSSFELSVFGHYGVPCYSLVFGNIIGGAFNLLFDSLESCSYVPGAEGGFFNVYTYLHGPYVVFGDIGVYCIMALLGGVYAVIFHFSMVKGGPFLILSSVLIYPLIMIFYDWQFDLSNYIYVILIAFPLFIRVKENQNLGFINEN